MMQIVACVCDPLSYPIFLMRRETNASVTQVLYGSASSVDQDYRSGSTGNVPISCKQPNISIIVGTACPL